PNGRLLAAKSHVRGAAPATPWWRSAPGRRSVMAGGIWAGVGRALAAYIFGGLISQAAAETLGEHRAEVRMQRECAVPDAALKAFRPAGFEPNVATSGAAKDCTLRMVFIDRVDVTRPDGAPAGSDRLVYLAAPIKQTATNTLGQMLIFGITTD